MKKDFASTLVVLSAMISMVVLLVLFFLGVIQLSV